MVGSFTARTFEESRDLERVAVFLVRGRSIVGHFGFHHLGDLSWNLYLRELRARPAEHFRVWEDGNELLGFAIFYPSGQVDIQSAPDLPNRDLLETEMLEWGMGLRRELPPNDDGLLQLSTGAFEQDSQMLALLDSKGFRREENHELHMFCDLAEDLPESSPPPGSKVCSVSELSVAARCDLQRTVWPWSLLSAETYPRLTSLPGYRPDLDLVAVTSEGDLASFALCWYDEVNRVGEFEPVGTDPLFRGQGLGKSVLLEGLRRLRDLGAKGCLVYPPGSEVPACRLYASAGFKPIERFFHYSVTCL